MYCVMKMRNAIVFAILLASLAVCVSSVRTGQSKGSMLRKKSLDVYAEELNDNNSGALNNNDQDSNRGNNNEESVNDNQDLQQDDSNAQKQSSNNQESSYGKQKPYHLGSAKIISQPVEPQTLNEIYQNAQQQRVLLDLKFACDFQKWNPRNPNSGFEWAGGALGLNYITADNAAFRIQNDNSGYDGRRRSAYGDETTKNACAKGSYVKLTSLPFTNNAYNEGYLQQKMNYSVNSMQRIVGRIKYSCHVEGVNENPFPRSLVTNAQNDPRFASCQLSMHGIGSDQILLYFYIAVVNEGVWAIYSGTNFLSKRLIGIRERYDSIVDAAIELDKKTNVVNYYVNGYKAWTITALGAPPPNDGVTKTDYGAPGPAQVITLNSVQFLFGTGKCPDESDPNNQQNQTRLVRVSDFDSSLYGPNAVFYDPNATHSNIAFGQGAIMNLYRLVIVETVSSKTGQQPLETTTTEATTKIGCRNQDDCPAGTVCRSGGIFVGGGHGPVCTPSTCSCMSSE